GIDVSRRSEEDAGRRLRGSFWILPIMLLSGGNAFVYEVLWTRLLGHILGGSVAAFATMLASFLCGIAIGSAVAARFAKDRAAAISGFIVVQCGIAVASILIYQLLPLAIPESVGLKGNVPLTIFILLPATLFIGATFPLAVRILANDEYDAAPASARVYSWNTVGAIAGATVAAFFLIPALRYEGAIKFAVTINIFLAVGTALLIGTHRRAVTAATVAAAAIVLLIYKPPIPEEILRTSPVVANRTGEMVYYEVGRSATVIVLEESGFFNLRTNGLPEASTNLKGAPPYKHNQRLLTAMTVLARPDTEDMLVVGFGAGAALEGVPPSVKSIDAIELEPEVINANRFMSDERQYDPLADERVNVFINDARSALALTDKRYDAIVSQPSHPWTAGASHLYTREYMSLANEHLTDDGVYLQWMNTQFVDEDLLKSLCASMLDVFDHVRVYQWDPEVLFFLGSNQPLNVETDMATSGRPLSDDTVHYLEQGVGSVEDVIVALTMDHENVVAFADGALPITDDFNRMATKSATAMDNKDTLTVNKLVDVLQPFDPLLDQNSWIHRDFPVKLNFTYVSNRLESIYLKKRAVALADTLIELRDSESLVMIGLGQQRQNEVQQSQRNLLLAIDADPTDHQARYALLRPLLSRISRNEDLPQRIDEELNTIRGSGAITIRAWLAATQQNWQEVAQLDEALATIRTTDLWYRDSVKLRADWRIKVTTEGLQPKLAIEAIRLIDNAIALFQDPDFYVMRLAAAYVADDPVNIIETARRVIYIFDTEVDRTAAGEIEPDMLSLRGKMLQVKAVEQILDSLANDDRIAPYKVRELDAAISRIAARLQELISDRQ
ncbi:MAG: spermidine synthase, partial [Woeseiaceae bacterium]